MTFPQFAKVIVDAPLPELDYTVGDEVQLMVGDRVLVPLGARKVVGIVTGLSDSTEVAAGKLKSVLRVFHEVEPLRKEWLKTMAFAADYYLRPRGEAAPRAWLGASGSPRAPGPSRQGLPAQRLGFMVRSLPLRASVLHSAQE